MSRKRLTPRDEERVVMLRKEGHTLAEIADRFSCSRATVWNALNARAETGESDARARIAALAEQARRHSTSGCSSGGSSEDKLNRARTERDRVVDEDSSPEAGP